MSDNYNREDLDEEVNKVMEDNTEQDLSTVNDSELTTDTEADNNKGEKEKAAKNKKEPKPKKEKKPKTKECKKSDKQASTEETSGEVIEESTAGEDIKTKVKDKRLKRKERRDKKKMEILDNLIGEEKAEEVIEKVKEAKKGISFMFRILICTILPLTFMFAISLLFTRDFIEKTIEEDRTTTLQTAASAIKSAYVYGYEGEYMVDGSGALFKGETRLTGNNSLLDTLKKETGIESALYLSLIHI